jgi:hypothetical protein
VWSARGLGVRVSFPAAQVAKVKALACAAGGERRWSGAEITRRRSSAEVSGAKVWRWLSEDAIRPWSYYSWNFSRDPRVKEKAGLILDLYESRRQGHCSNRVILRQQTSRRPSAVLRGSLAVPWQASRVLPTP